MNTIPFPSPPAEVRSARRAADKIAEARAIGEGMLHRNRENAADAIRVGNLLREAKIDAMREENIGAGHSRTRGWWGRYLAKHWPGLHERTARRWMYRAKTDTVSVFEKEFNETTHSAKLDWDERLGDPDAVCDLCQRIVDICLPALPDCPVCRSLQEGKPIVRARPPASVPPPPPPPPAAKPRPADRPSIDLDPTATATAEAHETLRTLTALQGQIQRVAEGPLGEEFQRQAQLSGIEFDGARCKPLASLERVLSKLAPTR